MSATSGWGRPSDGAIWDHARASGAAVVSKDGWIRLPNTWRRDLLAWFSAMLPQVLAALERGETLIDVT